MQAEQQLTFGPYRVNPHTGQLWRSKQEVRLMPKALAVLRALLERAGQVVTKEEIFHIVWPDTAVSDAALTTCIQEVRQALHDNARHPRYIETVHRRGFRFLPAVTVQSVSSATFQVPSQEEVASSQHSVVSSQEDERQEPALSFAEGANGDSLASSVQRLESQTSGPLSHDVQTLDDSAPRRLRPRTGLFVAAALLLAGTVFTLLYLSRPTLSTQSSVLVTEEAQPPALPLPDKPSIVVLPFTNLSGDPDQDYFSDGLTDVLTGHLSQISSLFVIARNSAFTYKGKAVKVQEVSKELGVRYILQGSVQKTDQRVRITVQLIDATSGYHLWSEQYDRPLQDFFALQDEIVQRIVTTLKLQLTLHEQGYSVRCKHTDNLDAYDAALRGVWYVTYYTKEANAQARQMYEKAIALDPQYADIYVALGWTYYVEWELRWSADPQNLERAETLAQEALARDNFLPEAHSLLSRVYALHQQYDQAITEGERAVALDPNDAYSYAHQATVLIYAGQPEKALRAVKQAMRLDPHYPPWYLVELGFTYRATGRYAEAIATLQEAISRSPNFLPAHLNLAISYLGQWAAQQSPTSQTLEPAMTAIQRALALNDSFYWSHVHLGYIYLNQGQYELALKEMERAVALVPTVAESHSALAVVLSSMGRTEDALEAAAQALRLKPEFADGHLADVGAAYALAGRYEEARAPLQRFLSRYPNLLPFHLMLAAVYSELGQTAEAQKEAAEVLRLNPNFSLEVHKQRAPIKDPAVLERHITALRKAGLN